MLCKIRKGIKLTGATHSDNPILLFLGSWDKKAAFTLAELLITLGVIGVVAAITLPTLLTNIAERARNEQVRTFKYKFTNSASKMNVMGQMIPYENTDTFIKVFTEHFKIVSKCDNNNLEKCWPAKKVYVPNSGGFLQEKSINSIKTGEDLQALALGTKNTQTMGIISGDGVSMILVYSPGCNIAEGAGQSWSMVEGKPETNAATSCISGIYDINGAKGPNRIGVDIRTFNSLYGSVNLGTSYQALSEDECNRYKKKLGIKECRPGGNDRWAGAMKACYDLKLHLPSMNTLATAAGSQFGMSGLGVYDRINYPDCSSCQNHGINYNIPQDNTENAVSISGNLWSFFESSATLSWLRYLNSSRSLVEKSNRSYIYSALCVGD